jgi:hypothetical protein
LREKAAREGGLHLWATVGRECFGVLPFDRLAAEAGLQLLLSGVDRKEFVEGLVHVVADEFFAFDVEQGEERPVEASPDLIRRVEIEVVGFSSRARFEPYWI